MTLTVAFEALKQIIQLNVITSESKVNRSIERNKLLAKYFCCGLVLLNKWIYMCRLLLELNSRYNVSRTFNCKYSMFCHFHWYVSFKILLAPGKVPAIQTVTFVLVDPIHTTAIFFTSLYNHLEIGNLIYYWNAKFLLVNNIDLVLQLLRNMRSIIRVNAVSRFGILKPIQTASLFLTANFLLSSKLL